MTDEPKKTSKSQPTFAGQVGAKAARKLRARRHATSGVWFGLGMMGLIGWSVVVPTLLGALFFGGLWWTVHRGMSSPRPALRFFGSLVLRMGIVLAGFYFVGRGNWERLVACLLGFLFARFIVIRLTCTSGESDDSRPKEISHAP